VVASCLYLLLNVSVGVSISAAVNTSVQAATAAFSYYLIFILGRDSRPLGGYPPTVSAGDRPASGGGSECSHDHLRVLKTGDRHPPSG
jgi:hypothetical protein